ncbi:MAG: M13 family metallopeptidase [Parvularcula sp.]|jgi:putative endopeptidase|nr:M13 family metallopeptidase [Parvularcula sp.]
MAAKEKTAASDKAQRSVATRIGMIFSLAVLWTHTASAAEDIDPRPQDNFYIYVNGPWLDETGIPAEVPWISPFVSNTLQVQKEVRTVIEEAAADRSSEGTPHQLIGDFYRSFLNAEQNGSRALGSLDDTFERIRELGTGISFEELIAELFVQHTDRGFDVLLPEVTPLAFSVWPDRLNPKRSVLIIRPAGLGLPDRSYYASEDEDLAAGYRQHIANLLRAFKGAQADDMADLAYRLEAALADARLSSAALHDASATWHLVSTAELARKYPALDWHKLFQALGLADITTAVVTEPTYLERLDELILKTAPETWQAYYQWQVLRRYAPVLGGGYQQADFEFYGRRLMGNETPRPPKERAALATEAAFPFLVGQLWVDEYVSPETKPDALKLAHDIREAFAERIKSSTWLEADTQQAALQKLDSLLIKIGYPQERTRAFDISVSPDDIVGNLSRISSLRWQDDQIRLSQPVDRERWLDVPQSTNAYYNRSTNELAIPAGYLRPPFFDPQASAAANLGGIGTVIGHEMGHAFDDQGAQFDGSGQVSPWWQKSDRAQFDEMVEKLVGQYEEYEALPGRFVNGRLTVSENLGDLTGVTIAHAALMRALADGPEEQRTAQQQVFFEAYCRRLRAKYREPLMVRILTVDSHPPQEFRCLGPLSNFTPFYDVYGVSEGDGMYRAPEDRVSVW